MDKCGSCVDAVCADARLLASGRWTVGADGRTHWTRDTEPEEPRGVCGVRVLIREGVGHDHI